MTRVAPRRRRAVAIASAVTSALVFLPCPQAVAADGSPDPSLLSRFFPTTGQVTVATDDYSSYVYQWVQWQTGSRIANLRDNAGDALEQEVTLFTGGGCWSDGYDRNSWDSNYPTSFLDRFGDDSNRTNRAGGSGKSQGFATGRWYYHWLRLKGRCANGMRYVVKAQDSHRSGPCGGGYEYCVYADAGSPRDIIPYVDAYESGSTYRWRYQRLYNDGFEDGTRGWALVAQPGSSPYWKVITSTGALDRTKFLTFNCKNSPGCHIYQYAPTTVNADDLWTAEVAVRCVPAVPAASSCQISLGISGMGGNADEHVSRGIAVPNDGAWHIYGQRASRFSHHDKVRFLVSNDSTNNSLDVDFATLHHSDVYV